MLLDTSGLQSDLLVVEARARGPFFWASATKKWTIIDWKVNVSKPAPIHGEHQSPAQWPHTRIFPGKTKLVLQPRSSTQTYNQEPNNIQQTYTKPTFSRSPKPTNDKQLTNQNTGRCCHHARKSCPHGETGFASVFGHQNGHKFRRKRNSSLDTSMAKPTPKHLLRMVEREVHLECLGASVERPV